MDHAHFNDLGRRKSDATDLSVAAAHRNRTTVWRIRASRPAVGTTVRTPGVGMLARGQHGSGRMLAWSNGTGIGTWSDDRAPAFTRVASNVSRVTQLGISGGLTPRIWYVAGAARRQRLATTRLDRWAPRVNWSRYRVVGRKSGRLKLSYGFGAKDEAGLDRTVVQVRSGPAAGALGKWRTLKAISHKGRFSASDRASIRTKRGFRYCMRIRSRECTARGFPR